MGRLACGVLGFLAPLALLGSLNDECQQIVGGDGIGGQEVVEAITQCRFHQAGGLRAGQLLLGLSLEMRFTNEDGELGGERRQNILGHDGSGALIGTMFAPGAQSF